MPIEVRLYNILECCFAVEPWAERWDQVVLRSASFDIYHTSSYHRAVQEYESLTARLFVYIYDDEFVAIPLLFERVGFEEIQRRPKFVNASSVYGYPGPISSVDPIPDRLRQGFCESLERFLLQRNVVSVSSRLNPFLSGPDVFRNFGRVNAKGTTVLIDLRAPEESQYAQYRTNHKRDLAKLAQCGYTTRWDEDFRYLGEFIRLYSDHMVRIGADDRYFFGDGYFSRLKEELADRMCLFVCQQGREIAGAALFFVCNEYAQYHLGAVAESHAKCSPLKQVIDVARREFVARNCSVLHLGGGLGGDEDSLFHFKSGFSKLRRPFHTWYWSMREASNGFDSSGQLRYHMVGRPDCGHSLTWPSSAGAEFDTSTEGPRRTSSGSSQTQRPAHAGANRLDS